MPAEEFEIVDGVRRSKAAIIAGHSSIPAQIDDGSGVLGPVVAIPLDNLHSPHKDRIDVASPRTRQRWLDILKATQSGSVLPPIIVRRGHKGPRVRDVDFQY